MIAKANTQGGARMGERQGLGRTQMSRRPEAIDDDIGAVHPGGFVAAFAMPLDRGP